MIPISQRHFVEFAEVILHYPVIEADRNLFFRLQRDDAGSLPETDRQEALVALAMEGKFASEGLQALDGDDNMRTAMGRELVQNRDIGESADLLWKRP